MLNEYWLIDDRLFKWSRIIALNNWYTVNNSSLPTAIGNNERPIVYGRHRWWQHLTCASAQHQAAPRLAPLDKWITGKLSGRRSQTSQCMWRVYVNCTRQAGGLDKYPAHCVACSPFIEGEQLTPVSAGGHGVCRTMIVGPWLCG